MTTKETQVVISNFMESLLSGHRSRCSELAHSYLENGMPIQDLYENIIKPSLYEIGRLWERNKISVAAEHLAAAIVETIMNELYHKVVSGKKEGKHVVVASVENEYHQIGVKMISDVFELNNWNSHFLGANTPTKELINFVKLVKPDILALSLTLYFHLMNLEEMVQIFRNEFPELPVLVGGQAFKHGGLDILQKHHNVVFLPDIYKTEQYINNLC